METTYYSIISFNDVKGTDYIEVRPGKHRRKKIHHTSIFFLPDTFALFEGIIWEKFREYSPTTTNAITTSDWLRIAEGFESFLLANKTNLSMDEFKESLHLRSYKTLPAYEDEMVFKEELILMIETFYDWILKMAKTEKYISICV